MNFDRSLIIALSFICLSIGSAIYVSAAAVNYLSLFPALGQLQTSISKLLFTRGPGFNQSTVTAQISVSNPTGYSGLRLAYVSAVISFFVDTNNSITLFASPSELSSTKSSSDQIGPNSVDSVNLPILLGSAQTSQLLSFAGKYPGQVIARASLRVDVLTFLVSVTGSVPFTSTQDIPFTVN